MSPPANPEILRRAFDAFNRGDLEEAVSAIAPDAEYVTTGIIPGVGDAYRGPEGFLRFVRWMQEEFDEPRVEVHELIDAGEYVVAPVTLHGSGKQSGVEASWDLWQVWRLRDGLAVHGQAFTDAEDAFRAAGLDPPGGDLGGR